MEEKTPHNDGEGGDWEIIVDKIKFNPLRKKKLKREEGKRKRNEANLK